MPVNVCDEMEACGKQAKTPVKTTCPHHVATCATFAYTQGLDWPLDFSSMRMVGHLCSGH